MGRNSTLNIKNNLLFKLPGLIIFCLFNIICFGQENGVRGAKEETGTAKATGNQYALVVGVSKYQNIQTLLYADDDAISFKEFLIDTKLVPEANIYSLIDSTATRSRFYAEIKKIMDKLKENDRVIIYFAGHGDVDNDIDAGFLLGFNCEATPYAASDAIDITTLEKYVDAFTEKKKAKVILISDACRSGKLTGGAHGAELTLTALSSRFKNTMKILSCGPTELSEETNFRGGGHGIFTYYLLQALYGLADEDNNNLITQKELERFLKDKVSKSTNDRQNPIIEGGSANQVILEVTAELKTAMLAKAKSDGENKSVATRTFAQKKYNGVSVTDSLLIKRFYTQLRDNKLNTPEGDNAYETFLRAKKTITDVDLVNSMKYDLAAGLEDDVQPLLNRFTRGEFQDYPYELFSVANKKLQIIKSDLIAPDDYRYNDIEALRIFFSKAGYYNEAVLHDLLKADSIFPNAAYINCEIARCYSERKIPDTANAFKYFRKSMLLAPTWPFPHLIAGLFYMDMKMYDQARAAFEKALSIKKDFKLALINSGVLYSKLNEDDKVISYYRKALAIAEPESDVLYSNIGLYWKNRSNYDSALYYQRKGYNVNALDIYNITGLINSFTKLKHPDSAKYYTTLLENITLSAADEFKTVGNTFYDLGEYEKALKYYNKGLAIKVDRDIYNNMGLTYDKMKNKEMAKKYYALANEMNSIESGLTTSDTKNSTHKANSIIIPAAISTSSGRASSLGSSATRAEDIRKMGDTYVNALDYKEAVIYYSKALAVKSSPYIYNNLGLAYENLQQLAEAKKYYRAALQLDPEYLVSMRNLALLYSKAENYDSAFYFLRTRLSINPADVSSLSFMLSNFAKLSLKDSVTAYENKIETIKTDNAEDIGIIADAFLDIPDYKKAVNYYTRSIALKPSTVAYNNLGLAYENLQDWANAKKYYLSALQLDPGYAVSIRNVALLYTKAGRYDSALYYYRKRYNADPNNVSNLSFMLGAFAKLQLADSINAYAKKIEGFTFNTPSEIREIADAFLDIGYYDNAISLYFKALAIKPSTDIYNNLALTYENAGQFNEAKKYYNMALALQPDYTTSLRNLGLLYNKLGTYDSSLYYYKKLYAVSPANVYNLSGLAKAFINLKQNDSAMFYINKVENINTVNTAELRTIGDLFLNLPDYPKAITIYNKALVIKPAEDIYNNLAIAYEGQQKYDNAIQAYNSAIKIKPDYVLSISNLASLYYRTKKYDSAIAYYRKIIPITNKPSATVYNSLADAFYNLVSYDSAIVYYKRAIALDSSHANYFVNLGEAYYNLGKYAESVPYLEKAYSMDTAYTFTYSDLAYGYLFIKKYNDAVVFYKKSLVIKPDPAFYNNLAYTYEKLEKYDEAKKTYLLALAIKPDYTRAMSNIASIYYRANNYDSAIIYAKKIIAYSEPTAETYNFLADALYGRGNYDSAISYYKKAIALDSTRINYFTNLGTSYYNLGKYAESVPYLEKAYSIDTSYTFIYSYLAYGYLFIKKYNAAIAFYKKALAIKPDAAYYNNLAFSYEGLGKYDEAKRIYQLALDIDPDYTRPMYNLASIYYREKNYDSAIVFYYKIISISGPSAVNYNSLADALFSKRNYDSAIVYYKKAIALDTTHANYYVNLGGAYYYLQQHAASVPYLEKALSMDPSYTSAFPQLAYGYMMTKRYDEAIALYTKILKSDTTNRASAYYNIACAKSVQLKTMEALDYLDKTLKSGYPELAHMAEDSDLDNIRTLPAFKKIMETYFKKEEIEKYPKLFGSK